MKPQISVVMPVLNGRRFIAEAIQSIVAQTYRPVQLVLVDDGSTDDTLEIARAHAAGLELTVVRHDKPMGIPVSMNDGLRHSTGELIAFLDHDDSWFPEFLTTQAAYLEQRPEVGMVHSDFQTIDVNGGIIESSVAACRNRVRPSGQVFRQLFLDSFIVGNSVLIRRECFTRLGLFDESLRWGDYHMWMRIARHYPIDFVPAVLTSYRQHPTQSTRSTADAHPFQNSVALQALTKILDEYPEARNEIGERAINRRQASLFLELGDSWWAKRHFPHARVCLKEAIRRSPGTPRYYALYAATLLGPTIAFAARNLWRQARGGSGPASDAKPGSGLTTGRAR